MRVRFTESDIRAEAVRLGLIRDGQELPRNLHGRVAASLVAASAQTPGDSRQEPRLAGEIVVQPGGTILIDGEPFPWLIATDPMDIRLTCGDGVSTVRLTLMAESVQITTPDGSE